MAWFRRIFAFLAVNIAVVVTISLILNLLGVQPYLNQYGLDYSQLMIFCLVWGMGGAFISLALSRVMAKWMMGVKVIDPNTNDPQLRQLVQMVHNLSRKADLSVMPEVGIYESQEVNAFATGPTRRRALVAVSAGLLHRMGRDEVEGVLGHEIAHVANGDMVTMTLVQGVVNAFVMFFARIIAFAVANSGRSEDNRGGSRGLQMMVTFALEIVFGILGSMVVAAYSRFREFRADKGGAEIAGREKMIGALQALQRTIGLANEPETARDANVAALKISGRKSWLNLFSTHPSLDVRIARLKAGNLSSPAYSRPGISTN